MIIGTIKLLHEYSHKIEHLKYVVKKWDTLFFFSGNTSGLLGYWDDSQELEYLKPDGTFLSTNSSFKEIHRNFGQLCNYYFLLIL